MSQQEQKKKSFFGKHGELWKFIKFTIVGGGSSIVELIVHMLLLNFVFANLKDAVVNNDVLNFIGIQYKGYMWSYIISTTVGYGIAFVLNRKITFKADSNATLSAVLYTLMVIFTIFAGSWIGTALSSLSVNNDWGNIGDLIIKVIVMAIPTLWTYPMNRFVIHRKKSEKNEEIDDTTQEIEQA